MNWRFWQWNRTDNDFDDEVAHDLALEAEDKVSQGFSREQAEIESRRNFGNLSQLREDVREIWVWASVHRLAQDVRYGWRTLRSNLSFAVMAVLSLGLGIGANTAVYSVMDAMLLRALPIRDPNELVVLNWRAKQEPEVARSHNGANYDAPKGGVESPDFPWPAYTLFRDRGDLFSALFAFKDAGRLNLVVHGQAEQGQVEYVSGNFFSGLGVNPAAGRLLSEADEVAAASQVAVVSYQYWRSRFNQDPSAIGQTVRINNIPFTITGVSAPDFFGVSPDSDPVLYIPIASRPALARNHGNEQTTMFVDAHFYWVEIMGRLRPGVDLLRAQAELSSPFHRFVLASAATQKERADLPSLWLEEGGSGVDSLRRRYSRPLLVLMTMVASILAIACANIANLLLSRALVRRREIAVRLSLGASRLRVVRQLVTESLMLALPGGLLGLGVAALSIRFLLWLLAGGQDGISLHAGIDWRILTFTLSLSLATGVLFGLVPAIEATRVDITPALKETRASTPRHRGSLIGLSQLLIITQIAFSLVLVLGAALFVKTLANLHSVQVGFNQEHLLTFRLDASQAGYKEAEGKAFYREMNNSFRSLPGVRSATLSDMPLVANWTSSVGLKVEGFARRTGRGGDGTALVLAGEKFFETMQLPILLGRPISPHDVDGAPRVAVVNQVFAKKYFPNQNPIGKRIGLNSDTADITIVGLAKDARYSSLKTAIPPVAYLSYFQNDLEGPLGAVFFELRTAGDPRSLSNSVRRTVHEAAPLVPVTEMMTQSQIIDSTITQERTFADLCSAFAILALAIACVGLYGSMAYAVSRRTNEIGIRMALGAERRRIIAMVIREVLALAGFGLALGLAISWGGVFAIRSYLFGVEPADPRMFVLTSLCLLAALLMAGYAPALRASRVDPLTALRHE